jgi:peptide deformylase
MILNPLNAKDPILRKSCKYIKPSELRTKKVQETINDMLDEVYRKNNKGNHRDTNKPMRVGLSANQVGINKQISIVDLAIGRKSYNDVHVLINPKIIWKSKSTFERREGCANLPKIWGYIKRSIRVKVKAMDRSGNKIELDLSGWSAVLAQHEIDHLYGTLFIDHLENPKKAHLVEPNEYKAHRKAKKKWNKFIDVSNLVKR